MFSSGCNRGILALASGVSGFNPLSLFAAGEQGGWYDPSDFSTMFQDSAGTTPAALESPVGKINDKSGRGNHLIQATAASRPTLSARYNRLTKTEQFDDAAWTKGDATVSANATTDPLGTSTADKIVEAATTADHRVFQAAATASGVKKLYAKAAERSWVSIRGTGGASVANFNVSTGVLGTSLNCTSSITSAGNGWFLCTMTETSPTIHCTVNLGDADTGTGTGYSYAGNGSSGLYLWGADIRTSADAALSIPTYQRVDTATSYDTSGFNPYLSFDGVDDGMASAATVDLSGTNKVTAFAGVYKASDAAAGLVFEHASGNFDGSFYLGAPDRPGTTYGASTRGTIAANSGTITPFTAPVNNVLTLALDNGAGTTATQLQVRANGAAKTVTFDVGTTTAGNFANTTFYVGRRGGATLPFNGRIYQLIIRGATSTAAQIAATETYVGAKQGIAL